MKIEQKKFTRANGWENLSRKEGFDSTLCNLVIEFGNSEIIKDPAVYKDIQTGYPNADVLMNSTAREIYDTYVDDNTISLTAICFDKTKTKTAVAQTSSFKNSFEFQS